MLTPKQSWVKGSNKPDLSRKWSQLDDTTYVDESIVSEQQPQSQEVDICRDTITITVIFMYEESNPDDKAAPTNFPEQKLQMLIHKERDVIDVWAKTQQWLTSEFNYNEERGQMMLLYYKNEKVDKLDSLI